MIRRPPRPTRTDTLFPYKTLFRSHGLPIEIAIEKKYGKVGVKLDAVEFRQKCREYANAQIDIQRKDFKRLGVIGDWDHPYRSLDFRFEADELRALAQVIDNKSEERRAGTEGVLTCSYR